MKLKFCENLVYYRKKAGFTQQQLASELSVTPQAVSKWEKGSYPDGSLLPKLSTVLGVSLDVLFGLKDEEGRVDLENAVFEDIRQLPDDLKGKRAMEFFYSMVCAFNPSASPEHVSLPENFSRETYSLLRTNYEISVARLNPDMQYMCFMRIPENGINSYFMVTERITRLFELLSDENALRVISFAETMCRNYILTKDYISGELDIPYDEVSDIVDKCEKLGIMWQLTANTGGDPFPIYGYVHNVPLSGILTLAQSLVNYISNCEPNIDIWQRPPFRKQEKDENENS